MTLFEGDHRLGGHTHTVDVDLGGVRHPVDTGFLVFNHRTYPHLTALLDHFAVATAPSEMSFSVSLGDRDLEWAGTNLVTLFAQAANLARPAFWGMLRDIARFNRAAPRLSAREGEGRTLGEFLDQGRYGAAFRDWYLLPMAGAIWSCPPATMRDYPISTFVRFCANHGLLDLTGRPQWYTVRGGGRTYVERLAQRVGRIVRGAPVLSVASGEHRAAVVTRDGAHEFDAVVLACHGDRALRLLRSPTDAERSVLGCVRYQPNLAVLHTDEALLPRRRRAWAAWNYLGASNAPSDRPVGVSYLINKLQPLPFEQPVVVTLNPPRAARPERVLGTFQFEHPVFDRAMIAAQHALPAIQGARRVWFCGAWTGHGFHEDGVRSAIVVANALGARAPWQRAADVAPVPLVRVPQLALER